MNISSPHLLTDLEGPPEIEKLVNSFYVKVRADETLGFIFDGIASVDWDAHLPKMYAFWEKVLFRTGSYTGNPLAIHARLLPLTEMGKPQFDRWLELFKQSVDELFCGPNAEHIKNCAADMANVIYSRLNNVPNPGTDPASLTAEQRARYAAYGRTAAV
ncbi:group III truncated hemoglobin [Prosthecobacter sp. SYSU 5D2]|uniref:group III truncated hemoglobin n=1 Tax=Prosthecobacter sp. SYSU 5D2 TaxID=3134134 RepID=UPI0031FEB9E9